MAFIKLENCAQQVFKDMWLSAPPGAYVFDSASDEPIEIKERTKFYTLGNNRKGIGRYRINMIGPDERLVYCMNYMMDDDKKKYHAIWRLEEKPYTAQDILEKYGWHVTEDHQRAKKYKLTGRKRAHRIANVLKEQGRHDDATKLLQDMEECVSSGERFICNFPDAKP